MEPEAAVHYEEPGRSYADIYVEDKELEAIFQREFGSKKQQDD